MVTPTSAEEYIAAQAPEAQPRLQELRAIIRAAVPDVVEVISYGMPTYKLGRKRVHFAAAKRHCALYGVGDGTIRFPLDQPIPEDLVRELVVTKLEG
jgi:uncharacterized protein YdhG (YjbR/CyaY superfamily)